MQPIPCAHCGFNFMRQTIDPEAPKLCHNCALREERRSPTKKETMKTIDVVIKLPVGIQAEIEEYCINQGMDFSKYFLSLHHFFAENSEACKGAPKFSAQEVLVDPKPSGKPDFVTTKKEMDEKSKTYSTKGKKK